MIKHEDLSFREKIDLMVACLLRELIDEDQEKGFEMLDRGWYPGIVFIPKDENPGMETDVYCMATLMNPDHIPDDPGVYQIHTSNIGFLLKHNEIPGFIEVMNKLDYKLKHETLMKDQLPGAETLEDLLLPDPAKDFKDSPLDLQALHLQVKKTMDDLEVRGKAREIWEGSNTSYAS
jgi:hypothetical protein